MTAVAPQLGAARSWLSSGLLNWDMAQPKCGRTAFMAHRDTSAYRCVALHCTMWRCWYTMGGVPLPSLAHIAVPSAGLVSPRPTQRGGVSSVHVYSGISPLGDVSKVSLDEVICTLSPTERLSLRYRRPIPWKLLAYVGGTNTHCSSGPWPRPCRFMFWLWALISRSWVSSAC